MIQWLDETNVDEGVYKTVAEIEDATGLNYKEQRYARKRLIKLGALSEKYERSNHRMVFQVDLEQINKLVRIVYAADEHLPKGQMAPAKRAVRI